LGLGERHLCRSRITIDVDTGRRLPHIPVLARHNEEPEVAQKTRPPGSGCYGGRPRPLGIQRALLFRCDLVSRPGGDVLPGLDAALQSWGIRTSGAWLEKFRRHEVAIG